MFFWMTIVGGLLMLVSWIFDPAGIVGTVGAVLFVVGVVWFFGLAYRTARRQGVSFGRAVGASARVAVRFAIDLMP